MLAWMHGEQQVWHKAQFISCLRLTLLRRVQRRCWPAIGGNRCIDALAVTLLHACELNVMARPLRQCKARLEVRASKYLCVCVCAGKEVDMAVHQSHTLFKLQQVE